MNWNLSMKRVNHLTNNQFLKTLLFKLKTNKKMIKKIKYQLLKK